MTIKTFCFNPFYENTYIIYEGSGEAWIIDPGCSTEIEENEVLNFIQDNKLRLTRLLLTHAHIDHILGLNFIFKQFGLLAEMHPLELPVFQSGKQISLMYGIPYIEPPKINTYIADNQIIILDNQPIKCILCPGHSPGSICYYIQEKNVLIGGDVLFDGSIGRTDLPGGDFKTLISSIKTKLYPLGNEVQVFPGHGGATTIGQEKLTNPFLN